MRRSEGNAWPDFEGGCVQILEELGEAIRPESASLLDFVIAAVIFVIAFPVARFVERIVKRGARQVNALSDSAVSLIGHASRYLTLIALASVALNLVGVNVGWAVGLALIFLLLVVLTLRPLLQNGAAGFVLKSRPSFAVGDEIGVLGYIGTVLSISTRTTVLRTRDGRRVHIPNTEMLDNPIVVYTAFDVRRMSIDLSVDPRVDLGLATELLVEAVSAIPYVRSEPPPAVIAAALRDGALELLVEFWFEPHGRSERAAIDGVVRAVHETLRWADIDVLPPRLKVDTSNP
jgi:small conductance mechanosensitive channel